MAKRMRKAGRWVLDGLVASSLGLSGVPELGGPGPPATVEPAAAERSRPAACRRGTGGVAGECEAFLAGRYLDVARSEAWLPAWVWVNVVAHAGLDELHDLAGGVDRANHFDSWSSYLAWEVLTSCARFGIPLRRAQREVLVPFELELAVAGRELIDRGDLIDAVLGRLRAAAATSGSDTAIGRREGRKP